mmetsp:Transcript_86072/g.224423  ORF Transcript_86072/g.224423 Transcript_86072/m.224423 type:complete len:344 (-) Transcript_86072:3-1034(-)
MAEGVRLAPLVLPGELVHIASVCASNSVEARDRSATQARERPKHCTLLLCDFGPLELVDHGIALMDRGLGQLLGGVLAAEGLEVAIGHLHVLPDGPGSSVGATTFVSAHGGRGAGRGLGVGGLLGVGVGVGDEEAVQRAVGELGSGVGGLGHDGGDDAAAGLEIDLVQLTVALHGHRAHHLDLAGVAARRCRHGRHEPILEIHRHGRVDVQLAVGCRRRVLFGNRAVQGLLHGLELLHDRRLRDGLHGRMCHIDRPCHRGGRGEGAVVCLVVGVVVMLVVAVVVVLVMVVGAVLIVRDHNAIRTQRQQRTYGGGSGHWEGCEAHHLCYNEAVRKSGGGHLSRA